jgi:hypothetical protein
MLNIVDMKWYVVFIGRKPGVYADWESCHNQVIGFSRACYRSFKTKGDVVAAYNRHLRATKVSEPVHDAEFEGVQPIEFGRAFIIALVMVLVVAAAFAKLLM